MSWVNASSRFTCASSWHSTALRRVSLQAALCGERMIFGSRMPAVIGTSISSLPSSTTSRRMPRSRQSQRKREPSMIASTGTARLINACRRKESTRRRTKNNATPQSQISTKRPRLFSPAQLGRFCVGTKAYACSTAFGDSAGREECVVAGEATRVRGPTDFLSICIAAEPSLISLAAGATLP